MKSSNRQGKMGGKNMDVSKDEIYQVAKEVVEKKTRFVYYIFGFFLIAGFISIATGIFILSLRLIFSSILVILFILLASKFFDSVKEEVIRKMVKEYDEKGI